MNRGLFLFVIVILMIIRYLAWAGLLFGLIFFLFGNFTRGIEFFMAGALLTGLKYLFGYLIKTFVSGDYK